MELLAMNRRMHRFLTPPKTHDSDTCLKIYEDQMSFMISLSNKTVLAMTETAGRI